MSDDLQTRETMLLAMTEKLDLGALARGPEYAEGPTNGCETDAELIVRLREVIDGQGVSMRAMTAEIAAFKARPSPPEPSEERVEAEAVLMMLEKAVAAGDPYREIALRCKDLRAVLIRDRDG